MKNGEAPMWLVTACQIYLDVYDLLDDHVSHGVDALHGAFVKRKEIASAVEAHGGTCAAAMGDVSDALETLEWVAGASNRFEQSLSIPRVGEHEFPAKQHSKIQDNVGCAAFEMERSLPAHRGAILVDLKMGMHAAGCSLANHGYYVLSAAYLYKALRAMGVLKGEWHNMDMVLKFFLVRSMGAEYDGKYAARQYLTALDLSAQDTLDVPVGNGRKAKMTPNQNEARKVQVTSPLLAACKHRQNTWKKHGLGYSKSKTVEIVLHALTASDKKSSESGKDGCHDSQLRQMFTPLQLLVTFKKSFSADEPLLNFDYTTFMLTCADLLGKIATLADAESGGSVASTAPYRHITLVADLPRSSPDSSAIVKGAEVLQSLISNDSRRFIKQAHDQSSGRILRLPVQTFSST